MSAITVAAVQFESTRDPEHNLAEVRRLAGEARARGADLIVFPEATMAAFGTKLTAVAEDLDGPFARGVRAIAAKLGAWIVVGMFTPAPDGRSFNTLLATDGHVQHRYDKLHLYDAFGYGESRTVAPGAELVTFDALGTTIGLATCYDVRFADQFTELGRRGAAVVCLCASWQQGPGKAEQWRLLSRARAMDSQSVLIAADQPLIRDPDSRALGVGCSQIAGPDGRVLAAAGEDEEIIVARVDLDDVARFRAAVPILG